MAQSHDVLKIHGLAMSACTSRVLAAVIEKEAVFEINTIDFWKGENKTPHYLKLQPFGVIPVLQDGDFYIYESRAIIRYIATKYHDVGTSLYGRTLQEKATIEQWLEVEAQNYNPLLSILVTELIINPRFGTPTNEIIVAEQLAKLEKVLDIYEAHFARTGNKFLAGDFFSLADLSHLPFTHYLVNVANRGSVITSRKHVNSWWQNISSRPSWEKVLSLHNK